MNTNNTVGSHEHIHLYDQEKKPPSYSKN